MIIHTPGFPTRYIDEDPPKNSVGQTSPLPSVAQAMALAQERHTLSYTQTPAQPSPLKVNLRTDGPTLEQWTAAGYKAENYPPEGYDKVPSPGLSAYESSASTSSESFGAVPHSVNDKPAVT